MNKVFKAPRDHLVHVMPELQVSGMTSLILEMVSRLQGEYQHTLLHETKSMDVDMGIVHQLEATGLSVLQADEITQEVIDEGGYTGSILYNVQGHEGIGDVVPSVYYSYGLLDGTCSPDLYAASSKYACTNRSYGADDKTVLDEDYIIPPMLNTRPLRRLISHKRSPMFTVGIFTSNYQDKYPCSTMIKLMGQLPDDIGVLINVLPKYKNPGVELAIANRKDRLKGRLGMARIMTGAALYYLSRCDAVIYATPDGHGEPGGRLVLEALALGKSVIVENKGVFPQMVEHGVSALLFDTVDEIIDYVNRLKGSEDMRNKLGANAQMVASWYDTSVHMSTLRRLLRMVGA